MRVVSYYCPATGKKVDGWVYERELEKRALTYDVVGCTACHGIHLVNLATSRTLAGERRRGGWPPPRAARRPVPDDGKKITTK
jgi:hypothetical protein